MPDFETDSIYRQYAEAYWRCTGIDMSIEELAIEHPNFEGVEAEYEKLRKDGDQAYFELLELQHRLTMCVSLDVAAIRAKLRDNGVFGEEKAEEGNESPDEEKAPANPNECPYNPHVVCSAAVHAYDVSDPERAEEFCAKCEHRKKDGEKCSSAQ